MNFEKSEEKSPIITKDELTPITKKELTGWYILCAANGIYGGAPIGVLIPLFLESIAGQAGYELDQVTPCNTAIANYNCVVRFGTGFISTESYSLYIISISVIVQTVLFISCGSLADHGSSISTILFVTITSPRAYIPPFARSHPKVIEARLSNEPISEIKKLEDKMTVDLSSHSLVAAIFACMLVMFSAGAILILTRGSSYGTQVALAFSGACWLILLIFPVIWLTNRPKPPLQDILPLYVLLGYWLPIGLNNRWEIWLYLVWFGISIGTISNYCRALFSLMVPMGHENEFFSLFQITAKGSSWIGTIASGIIVNITYDTRSPFWFLLVIIALPAIIFCTVNVEKGKEDAEKYSNREKKVDNY
ncbi:12167_t:CDS:10 [Dentiscutata erythropus]|uniref:Autophagy-related protein n=1 Tax=Dentiscutata erythropus TaxID=1348616 RepID=A0A9N8ZKS4_9GLOM|nr:12167_t:CDS:10 [Dentiscutata erythropus]